MTRLSLKGIYCLTLLIAITLFVPLSGYTQSHDLNCVNCKYWKRPSEAKGVVNDFCVCQGCKAKRDQETQARKVEDDRRKAVIEAKQKAEREEQERLAEKRRQAEMAKEAQRKENLARAQTDIEAAKRRASQIQGRYSNLSTVSGTKYEEEIKDLTAYNDKDYYGVQLNGEILWRLNNDGIPTRIDKVEGTNFFTLQTGSKYKLINLYGSPILINGDEWFDAISFNKKFNRFEFNSYDGDRDRLHPKALTCSGRKTAEVSGFYPSLGTPLEIHEANIEVDRACWELYSANNPGSGGILVMSSYLNGTSGTRVLTDIEFNVLSSEDGYFVSYSY